MDRTYPETETLLLEQKGAQLHLTFNRPENRNALTGEMMRELDEVAAVIQEDSSVRVVVLRGAGGNFCAGGDLKFMAEMPPLPLPGEADPLVAVYRRMGDFLIKLQNLPQAVISVVEGAAVGGGIGMVACSDAVIIHEKAKLGLPEPQSGFIPSQVIPFITQALGITQVRRIAVFGMRISGQEAFDLGLAHYCCRNEEEINDHLDRLINQILKCEPQAVATVKRLVFSVETNAVDSVLDDAAESLITLLRRPMGQAGIQSFLNKTPPPWLEK